MVLNMSNRLHCRIYCASTADVGAEEALCMIRCVSFCCSCTTTATSACSGSGMDLRCCAHVVWDCVCCSSVQAKGMKKQRAEGELSILSTDTSMCTRAGVGVAFVLSCMYRRLARMSLTHRDEHVIIETCPSLHPLLMRGRLYPHYFFFSFSLPSLHSLYRLCVHGSMYCTVRISNVRAK